MAVWKGRKKCVVGKNCGGSCINRQKICQMELKPSYQLLLRQVAYVAKNYKSEAKSEETPQALLAKAKEDYARIMRDQQNLLKDNKIKEAMERNPSLKEAAARVGKYAKEVEGPPKVQSATVGTRIARGDAKKFDEDLATKELEKIGPTVNWGESKESGSKVLGSGAYGTVVKTPDGKEAHKRGDLGEEEATVLKKVGEAGIGPKFFGAEINGPGRRDNTRKGRIAMEALDAKPIGEHPPDFIIAGKKASDIYWETRAAVHRLGIQHGDMHHENVLVDKNGKGKIIDMGVAKDNPKAALSEALGIGSTGGDWQVGRWKSTGGMLLSDVEAGSKPQKELAEKAPLLAKVLDNKTKVEAEMQKMGLSPSEIREIGETQIRSNNKVYESGAFTKIDNEQAMRLINMLYEGV